MGKQLAVSMLFVSMGVLGLASASPARADEDLLAEGAGRSLDCAGGYLVYSNTRDVVEWYVTPPVGPGAYLAEPIGLSGAGQVLMAYEVGVFVGSGTMIVHTELWSSDGIEPVLPIVGSACTFEDLRNGIVMATCTVPPATVALPDDLFLLIEVEGEGRDGGILVADDAEVGYGEDWFLWGSAEDWFKHFFTSGMSGQAGFWVEVCAENVQQTCGNDLREGTEECDGTDDVNCPGECLADCTCPYQPCDLICPPAADLEQEPCDDSGLNRLNDGCNMDPGPPVFEPITCGETVCGTGWSLNDSRDTDWYEVVVANDTVFTLTFEAEFTALFGLIEYNEGDEGSGSCGDISGHVAPSSKVPKCTVGTVTTDCMPGGTYWFFVAAAFGSGDWPCGAPNYENDYHITLDCQTCVRPQCPEGSLYAQPLDDPDDGWVGSSDEASGDIRYERFHDLYGPLCGARWWGVMRETVEDPAWFTIKAYADDNGDLPGSELQSWTVSLSPVATGQQFGGEDIYAFETALTPCLPNGVYDGWISIQGFGGTLPDSRFFWLSAPQGTVGDGWSVLYDQTAPPGAEWSVETTNLSICLTGTFIEPIGACCAEWFPGTVPECFDGLQLTVCNQQPSWRFVPDGVCDPDPFDPPCGELAPTAGACCFAGPERECQFLAPADCAAAEGTYLGDDVTCGPPNPCQCTCLPGDVPEQDDNDGCDASLPSFEGVTLGTTVCGYASSEMVWESSGGAVWYAGLYRDSDWYAFPVQADGTLAWRVASELPIEFRIVEAGSGDCSDYTILAEGYTHGSCEAVEISACFEAGQTAWLVVTAPWACEDDIWGYYYATLLEPAVASAYPPDCQLDARQNHPFGDVHTCQGIGMAVDPITICLDDPSIAGACPDFTLCETLPDPNCGPNYIASCTELGSGCYELVLDHGIAAPAWTTIRHAGHTCAMYWHHPGNVDGSSVANLNDLLFLIDLVADCMGANPPTDCSWRADIDCSGTVNLTDVLREIDLLIGADAFAVWMNTPAPSSVGCP